MFKELFKKLGIELTEEQSKGISDAFSAEIQKQVDPLNLKLQQKEQEVEKILANKNTILEEKRALQSKIDNKQESDLMNAGDFETIKNNLINKHQLELQEKNNKIETLQNENNGLIVTQKIGEVFGPEKANIKSEGLFNLLVNNITKEAKVIDDNGTKNVYIGDKSIDLYLSDFKNSDTAKDLYKAPVNTGSGGGNPLDLTPTSTEIKVAQAEKNLNEGNGKLFDLVKAKNEHYENLKN